MYLYISVLARALHSAAGFQDYDWSNLWKRVVHHDVARHAAKDHPTTGGSTSSLFVLQTKFSQKACESQSVREDIPRL